MIHAHTRASTQFASFPLGMLVAVNITHANTAAGGHVQGNVFTFLQQSGGRLPEGVVVPMILEPTMSALHYIHELVRNSTLPPGP